MGGACSRKDTSKRGARLSEPTLDISALRAEFFTAFPNRFGKKEEASCMYGNSTFENLSNSCYLSVILQVLVHTQPLADYIASRAYDMEELRTEALDFDSKEVLRAFTAIMTTVWTQVYEIVAPKLMLRMLKKVKPSFDNGGQHDAHETYEVIVDKLHFCLNFNSNKRPSDTAWGEVASAETAWTSHIERNGSAIVDLMHGLMKSTLCCLKCGCTSTKFEVFSSILLSVTDQSTSLKSCMSEFTRAETLPKAWDCPSCNGKVDCVKKLDFVRLPPVLAIVLKRYSYPPCKLRHRLLCPVTDLFLEDLLPEASPASFDMYAKVVHVGSVDEGHYYVFTKHHITQHWQRYDDTEIEVVDAAAVEGDNQDTYMLFYYNKTLATYKRHGLSHRSTSQDKPVPKSVSTLEESLEMRSLMEERKQNRGILTPWLVELNSFSQADDVSLDDIEPPSYQFVGLTHTPNERKVDVKDPDQDD
jgi:ubiquitin C-terminal hydrolase